MRTIYTYNIIPIYVHMYLLISDHDSASFKKLGILCIIFCYFILKQKNVFLNVKMEVFALGTTLAFAIFMMEM